MATEAGQNKAEVLRTEYVAVFNHDASLDQKRKGNHGAKYNPHMRPNGGRV